MSIGNLLKKLLECGCCVPCVGCCFPIDEELGNLEDLDWEISDPSSNCPGISNGTGIFTPIDPTNQVEGSCGYCSCYQNISNDPSIPGKFATGLADPFGDCSFSPCTITLNFRLSCDPNEEVSEGESCCSRLRLLVRGNISQNGELEGTEANSNNCGNLEEGQWIELTPSDCSCDPMVATFDLSDLSIFCNDGNWSGPPCDGEPKCCQISCDLTNVTLNVAVRP